ncbi:hypothetical protein BCR44DRAFT_1119877 [Catenaria anguillulae PL171]|uniref:Uncharacterized protein n=1 Tax=Catenaria anguillulae PL171 TaxID=765915 RepID=A0A1Y2HLK6_9FUNG|nr:hypothetical protein BCR44DRAFT_1119877 [Catenaria anguillulae PL171]
MKSTLILAAALVASVAAAPSYNAPAPGSNYDAAKPAPAPIQPGYDAAKPAPAPVQPGYNGDAKPAPAVTTPCSSAAAAKPTVPASNYNGVPAPAPTGAYDGVSPDGKKPCTTAVADQVAIPSTTPCEKSAAKTTDAYEQAAPAQPTGAYDVKIQPAGQQNTDGSLYQASSAGKVGGSVVALMVAGAGLLVL